MQSISGASIPISGTAGGAQSVSLSFSNNKLTVSVDGHSDSVNITTTSPTPFTGTIDMSGSYWRGDDTQSSITYSYVQTQFRDETSKESTTFSNNVTVTAKTWSTTSSYSFRNSSGSANAFHYILAQEPTYNISGSGTVSIYFNSVSGYSSYSHTFYTTSSPHVSFTFSNGRLSSNTSNLYASNNRFSAMLNVTSVSIS